MKHCHIRECSTGRTARVPEALAAALVSAGKHEYVDGRKARHTSHSSDKPKSSQSKKRQYKRRDLKAEG